MSYQKSYSLLLIGVIGEAVAVFIGLSLSMKISFLGSAVAFLGLAAMLGSFVQALIFCKCQKCGAVAKIRGSNPDFFHKCWYKLNL